MTASSAQSLRLFEARLLAAGARVYVAEAADLIETALPPVCRFCGERILFDAGWRRCGCKVSAEPANDGAERLPAMTDRPGAVASGARGSFLTDDEHPGFPVHLLHAPKTGTGA
jgi:hypothetical protein